MTILPPPLRPGARVHVVAPSGPFDRCLVLRGLGWLAERYRVTFAPDLFARRGFLAGSDERRTRELTQALVDPEIAAIV
ncbi:MAG: LD-carboxypeptidase, partial [Myxococcales bacterium]